MWDMYFYLLVIALTAQHGNELFWLVLILRSNIIT